LLRLSHTPWLRTNSRWCSYRSHPLLSDWTLHTVAPGMMKPLASVKWLVLQEMPDQKVPHSHIMVGKSRKFRRGELRTKVSNQMTRNFNDSGF
jgi:hypothetical protein